MPRGREETGRVPMHRRHSAVERRHSHAVERDGVGVRAEAEQQAHHLHLPKGCREVEGREPVRTSIVHGGPLAQQQDSHNADIADRRCVEEVETVRRLSRHGGEPVGHPGVAREGGCQDRRQPGIVASPHQGSLVGADRGVDGHVVALANGFEECRGGGLPAGHPLFLTVESASESRPAPPARGAPRPGARSLRARCSGRNRPEPSLPSPPGRSWIDFVASSSPSQTAMPRPAQLRGHVARLPAGQSERERGHALFDAGRIDDAAQAQPGHAAECCQRAKGEPSFGGADRPDSRGQSLSPRRSLARTAEFPAQPLQVAERPDQPGDRLARKRAGLPLSRWNVGGGRTLYAVSCSRRSRLPYRRPRCGPKNL